uniref:Putative endonuclease/reverse transcriptase n=1 Tax=Ixodes ricinus TaxID=34613 RepID=A0A0K8RLQ9_IXORI
MNASTFVLLKNSGSRLFQSLTAEGKKEYRKVLLLKEYSVSVLQCLCLVVLVWEKFTYLFLSILKASFKRRYKNLSLPSFARSAIVSRLDLFSNYFFAKRHTIHFGNDE